MKADGLLQGQQNNPSAHAEQIRARVSVIQLAAAAPCSFPSGLRGAPSEKDHTQIVSVFGPGLLNSVHFALIAALVVSAPTLSVVVIRLCS